MRCWRAGPDATPFGLSHRLSTIKVGSRERKRVKNLGRAKRPSPALGATALSEGGRFLGKPTIAEGQDGYGWCFLRQCGTYPRPRRLSCGLVCFCFWSAAAAYTHSRRQTRSKVDRLDRPAIAIPFLPIPARTTYISWMSCHVYLICADVPPRLV